MKNIIHELKICIMLVFLLPLSGCGREVCDYCGETRFCENYDINGTERHICKDCLNDPQIGIYGNVVREYSELYENGTLEYPENSPMRMEYSRETGVVLPETEEPEAEIDKEAEIARILGEQTPRVEIPLPANYNITPTPSAEGAEAGQNGVQNETVPGTDGTAAPAGRENSLSGEQLVSALNGSLANNGYSIVPGTGSGEYSLQKDGADLNIRLKMSPSASGGDGLSVEMMPEGSPSDYVKAVIRSILTYVNSDDYDGLGHDIYNNTIQQGSYNYMGLNFSSAVHTPEEIEKGAPASGFTITP